MTQNNLFLYTVILLGTALWGAYSTIRSFYLRDGRALKSVPPQVAVVYEMIGAVLTACAFGALWEATYGGGLRITPGFWIPILITGVLNTGSENLMARAQKLEDNSVIAPLAGTMPAWAVIVGWYVNQQWPTKWGYIGVSLVAFGVYLNKLSGTPVKPPLVVRAFFPMRYWESVTFYVAPWVRLFGSRGAFYAVIVAWCGAFSQNFDWRAVHAGSVFMHSAFAFGIIGLVTYGQALASGEWGALDKSGARPFVWLGVLRGTLNVLVQSATLFAIAANVGALKRLWIIWAMLFAARYLGEKVTPLAILGAAVVVAGSIAIAF